MPKISVLLPTYNTNPTHLTDAIDSILNQTFTDFELLILDDASTTTDIKKIVSIYTDPRIKFFENTQNLGISESRNRLLKLATGDYLAIHDHDDISLPTRFELQASYLDTHGDVGVIGAYYCIIPDNRIIKLPTTNRDIENSFMYSCQIAHPVTMIRKKSLLEANLCYEREYSPAEDYRLWNQLLGKTNFAAIPSVLLHYRWHDNNTTILKAKEMANATQRIIQNTREEHQDLWERAQEELPLIEKKYKLFSRLTLLKTLHKNRVTQYFAFGRLLFLTTYKKIRYSKW